MLCFALPFNMGKYHICHGGVLGRLVYIYIYVVSKGTWLFKFCIVSSKKEGMMRKFNFSFINFRQTFLCKCFMHIYRTLLISTCISIGKNIMETEIWSGSWKKQSCNASILQGALISMKISECIMHFEYTFCCTHSY